MKKILIIEDDHDIADIVEMVLSNRFLVLTHRKSAGIPGVVIEFKPDLILLDNAIGMTLANEIIKELRTSDASFNIPYILFSANDDIVHIAKEIGASSYLAKPFTFADLDKCIDTTLSVSSIKKPALNMKA